MFIHNKVNVKKQCCGSASVIIFSGSGSSYQQAKNKKNLDFYYFVTSF